MIMRRANKWLARPSARPIVVLLSLLLLLPLAAPDAGAGPDDFEFAQKLAAKGRALGDPAWFDYARMVYERMIEDGHDADLAKYGIATLLHEEALAAAGRDTIPYSEVKSLFQEAVAGIEAFVEKNPTHAKFREAKLSVGMTRLAFVQWARDLLTDPERMADRGSDEGTVQADARDMVEKAIKYFDELDDGWDGDAQTDKEWKQIQFAQLAHYYFVVCKYYLALVHTPCSEGAINALQSAGADLEDFIGFFDGMTVAVYAQDFYGLTFWELAKCDTSEEEQADNFRSAVQWFETCIETSHTDLDTLKIIGRGYYHIAQCCLAAGRVGGENFYKRGAGFLRKMTARVPTVNSTDEGIRAMIEWAKIEVELDNADRAITILSEAGQKAEDTGRPWLARQANRVISEILARSTGTSTGTSDPDVLKRVADDQYAQKSYRSAIGAYQRVIAACSDSVEDLMNYAIPSWERIATSYHELGDPLSAALATFPIHNAWVDGRVPHKKGDENDANMLRMGNNRLKAQRELKDLFDLTNSRVYESLWRSIGNDFKADYPDHPSNDIGELRKANTLYSEANALKKKGDSNWRAKLDEAVKIYETISKDIEHSHQHYALVRLIRAERMRENPKAMIERADAAFAYWESPAAKKAAKTHETIANRIEAQRGMATYWKAVALDDLNRSDDVIALLQDYGVKHAGVKDEFIQGDVLGMLVLAYVQKNDIDTADKYLRQLLATYPTYPRLPKITFELAGYYNEQYSDIEKLYKEALAKKYGPPEDRDAGLVDRLLAAEKDENFVAEALVDLVGDRSRNESLIEVWNDALKTAKEENRDVNDIVKGVDEKMVVIAKAKLKGQKEPPADLEESDWPETYQKGLINVIDGLNKQLNELRAERQDLELQLIDVNKDIERYRAEMYPPLIRAANYYYDWLQVLIANGEKPTARNLNVFGYRFYYATSLNPEDEDAWLKAREIYEMYRDLPGLEAEERADVAAKLGRIYSHLSDIADNEKDKREYVLKAVDLLQGAVAKNPKNTNLVVGLLTGDYVVIPYTSPLDFKSYRIPIRRVKDVADFRAAVAGLGSEDAPLPKFENDRAQMSYDNAVREFQKRIKKTNDKELQRTVKHFDDAGFDPTFYRQLGESGTAFRMALARVFAQSGRPDDARKALSLARTLIDSRTMGVEENSEEYWEAQVIRYRAYTKAAELRLAGTNTKAEAKEVLELATKSLRALYSQNPSLGQDVRPETAKELKAVLKDLNVLRLRSGMSPVNDLDLTPKAVIVGAGGSPDRDDTDDESGNSDDVNEDKDK